MMSQNSHVNGQPRENCTDMKVYLFSANRSKRGTGVRLTSGFSVILYSLLAEPRSRSAAISGKISSGSPTTTSSASGSNACGSLIQLGSTFERLAHAFALNRHRTDHHKIGPEDVLIAQLFKCKVNETDFPLFGTKRGDGDEPERRHERALWDDFHHFPKTPKRGRKARPDH